MINCPYCKQDAPLVDSKLLYGRSYGFIYWCRPCNAYVGTHKYDNVTPLGTLANAELREYRKKAHLVFDKRWRNGAGRRKLEYKKLADWLGIEVNDCHIGMFDKEKCMEVVKFCKENEQ